MTFAQTAFAQFLAGSAGRLTRIVAGIAIVWAGVLVDDPTLSVVLYAVGAIPIAAGLFDFCLVTALFGGPLSGRRVRALAV